MQSLGEDPVCEREVLALVAEGRSNSGIAHRLWISEGAVEKHVRSIPAKLQLPATARTTARELNRAMLGRQLLLERGGLRAADADAEEWLANRLDVPPNRYFHSWAKLPEAEVRVLPR